MAYMHEVGSSSGLNLAHHLKVAHHSSLRAEPLPNTAAAGIPEHAENQNTGGSPV